MKAVVLTYHSHHVLANEYGLNDHLALPLDLELITQAGYRIVPIRTIVERLNAAHETGATDADDDACFVALTFDDGPIYDLDDFQHPRLGLQRSFVGAMQDFVARHGAKRQPDLHATSFVIASPEARRVMEATYDTQYTYLGPGSMIELWWDRAIATGLLSIANHSWDHLHPALERVAHSKQARADFMQVVTERDADAQILVASRYIDARTGGRAAPFFAYPFGHCNDFLMTTYLPNRAKSVAGIVAAFTTEPRPVAENDNVYALPRYTCGHHWKTADELAAILASA